MNEKEIIALNNDKREQLNEENLFHYEEMLTYIRLSSSKSEQRTEEILLELLEHTIQAQQEGRTIKDVFGDDLKAYSQTVIEEIPKETKKKQLLFATFIIIRFLAYFSFASGIINYGLHIFFGIGESVATIHLGSGITIIIINLLILFFFIISVFTWLRSSLFKEKQKKKWVEFFQIWFFSTVSISLFIAIIYFMPDFGPTFSMPTYIYAIIGVVLFGLSYLFKNKNESNR